MDVSTLNRLLERGEDRNVEMKGAEAFSADFRAHIAASLIAMANTPDGGMIIIGVENTTWQVIGLDESQYKSFDPSLIGNYVNERVDPHPRFHVEQVAHPDGIIIVIQVQQFDATPIVVTKSIQDSKNRTFANPGDLLIRSRDGKTRRLQTAEEFRDLFRRGLHVMGETLLGQIRTLMTGIQPVPDAPDFSNQFAAIFPQWKTHIESWTSAHLKVAWWEVAILPLPLRKRVDVADIPSFLTQSSVRWRGWYFPNAGTGEPVFLQHAAMFAYAKKRNEEMWLMSDTGTFATTLVVGMDTIPQSEEYPQPPPPERFLSMEDLCWSLTEYFRFAANLAESLAPEQVWVQVTLHNVLGRTLGSSDPARGVFGKKGSITDNVHFDQGFTQGDLIGGWQQLASEWIHEIFTALQWPEIGQRVIYDLQQRLIERRW